MENKHSQKIMYAAAASSLHGKISSYFLDVETRAGDYSYQTYINTKFANAGTVCVVSTTKEGVSKKKYITVDNSKEYLIKLEYKTIIYGDIVDLTYTDAFTLSPDLTKINTDNLPNLNSLYLVSPKLYAYVNVSKNAMLQELSVGRSKTDQSELDLSNNTELSKLRIQEIPLTKLDLSKNKQLKSLRVEETQITTLNVNGFSMLQELTVSNINTLTKLECAKTAIQELDVTSLPSLKELDCGNTNIKALDVSKNTELTKLHCEYTGVSTLDTSANTKLKELYCHHASLQNIVLPYTASADNTTLHTINVSDNQITTLEVYSYRGLKKLNCSNNKLTELIVGKNVALQELICSDNALETLDCGALEKLTRVECTNNKLTTLDILNAIAIQTLLVASSKAVANNLANITCSNTSEAAYNDLNSSFDYFAATGTLTTDNTDASATLRATATAKGWTVVTE